jgi:hypothetical protein
LLAMALPRARSNQALTLASSILGNGIESQGLENPGFGWDPAAVYCKNLLDWQIICSAQHRG